MEKGEGGLVSWEVCCKPKIKDHLGLGIGFP